MSLIVAIRSMKSATARRCGIACRGSTSTLSRSISARGNLTPDQVEALAGIAEGLNRAIQHNPREVFLIEGYTDAVGADVDNLSLSDRRAESVAIALTQQFAVPAENLSTQGYGEQYLKIPTDGPERANRRVTVRRITPLLAGGVQ